MLIPWLLCLLPFTKAVDVTQGQDEVPIEIPEGLVPLLAFALPPAVEPLVESPSEVLQRRIYVPLPYRPEKQRGLLSDIYNALNNAYTEFQLRYKLFIDFVMCKQCPLTGENTTFNRVVSFVMGIPQLGWLFRPQTWNQTQTLGVGTFFAASEQNGIFSGVGGTLKNNLPVIEFVVTNKGVVFAKNTTFTIPNMDNVKDKDGVMVVEMGEKKEEGMVQKQYIGEAKKVIVHKEIVKDSVKLENESIEKGTVENVKEKIVKENLNEERKEEVVTKEQERKAEVVTKELERKGEVATKEQERRGEVATKEQERRGEVATKEQERKEEVVTEDKVTVS